MRTVWQLLGCLAIVSQKYGGTCREQDAAAARPICWASPATIFPVICAGINIAHIPSAQLQ